MYFGSLAVPVIFIAVKLAALLKRPEVSIEELPVLKELPPLLRLRCEIEIKYEGYITRQHRALKDTETLDRIYLPRPLAYAGIIGLSNEVIQKLNQHQPDNLGQASRLSGITPAAIQVLRIWLQGGKKKKIAADGVARL